MWLRFNTVAHGNDIMNHWAGGGQNSFVWFWNVWGTDMTFLASSDGSSSSNVFTETWSPSADTWYHVAVSRSGNTWRVFVDGTQLGSDTTDSRSLHDSTAILDICGTEAEAPLDGYLDEVRVSDNARYTSGFSVQTEDFASDVNTGLLIHSNEAIVTGTTGSGATFVDSGNTGHTVTEIGDAVRDESELPY
jgi:hypothetical protein